ncbi:type II secretion system protein [Tissierella praeacuta]|uniref:type II secretion system protein n=1 Tax=Tissierella praeacuta TaxID=43131 RepID=UPI0028B22B81|nr:type II secretion system protein [Tissierella praeacuta]
MLKWINKKKTKKGFTLVELVVVIAILGILAAIAVPKLGKSRVNAAIAAHNANVRTLESAATMAIADGATDVTWNGTASSNETDVTAWENYVQEWPNLSSQLKGKKVIFEGETTAKDIGIDKYEVVIGKDNSVTIKPGKIVPASKVE